MKRYSYDMDGYMEPDEDGDWAAWDEVLEDYDNLVLAHRTEISACHAEMLQLRTQIVNLQRENSRLKKEAEDCHADDKTLSAAVLQLETWLNAAQKCQQSASEGCSDSRGRLPGEAPDMYDEMSDFLEQHPIGSGSKP